MPRWCHGPKECITDSQIIPIRASRSLFGARSGDYNSAMSTWDVRAAVAPPGRLPVVWQLGVARELAFRTSVDDCFFGPSQSNTHGGHPGTHVTTTRQLAKHTRSPGHATHAPAIRHQSAAPGGTGAQPHGQPATHTRHALTAHLTLGFPPRHQLLRAHRTRRATTRPTHPRPRTEYTPSRADPATLPS